MGNTTSSPSPDTLIVDNIHGVATQDGKFLEHIAFWQEIKQEGQPDVVFDITVYAIPMDGTVGNSTAGQCFVKTGDVKKYVLGVTYIQDDVQYICTDLTNTNQPPVLNVQFGR